MSNLVEKLKLISELCADVRYTAAEKVILIALASTFHNTKSGKCNPSRAKLADATGQSTSTVKRALKKANGKTIRCNKCNGGRNRRNSYSFPALEKGVAGEPLNGVTSDPVSEIERGSNDADKGGHSEPRIEPMKRTALVERRPPDRSLSTKRVPDGTLTEAERVSSAPNEIGDTFALEEGPPPYDDIPDGPGEDDAFDLVGDVALLEQLRRERDAVNADLERQYAATGKANLGRISEIEDKIEEVEIRLGIRTAATADDWGSE